MDGCLYDFQSPLEILDITDPHWHQGTLNGGFHAFRALNLKPEVIQTLLDISEFSQALEIGLGRPIDKGLITPLLDSRSHLLYRLLSLPISVGEVLVQTPGIPSDENSEQVSPLYACARLAAQLYSLHVILPVPRTADVRQILLPQIMTQVSAMDKGMATNEASLQLTAWACMVAAIASSADSDEINNNSMEKWFARHLAVAAARLGIFGYGEMREVLQLFGWVNAACDKHGTIIWHTRWNE